MLYNISIDKISKFLLRKMNLYGNSNSIHDFQNPATAEKRGTWLKLSLTNRQSNKSPGPI